jgi:hypothetical protein
MHESGTYVMFTQAGADVKQAASCRDVGILGFRPQFIPIPQPLPRCVDRVLNPLHIATFANEDMNSPIRLVHFIDLIFNLDFGDMLTAGKSPDFLIAIRSRSCLARSSLDIAPLQWDALQTKVAENRSCVEEARALGRSAAVTPRPVGPGRH